MTADPNNPTKQSNASAATSEQRDDKSKRTRIAMLSLTALGVVYGDIGTSPLYAFREALKGVEPTVDAVLGILSMIVWSLTIVVTLKYLLLLMRADNNGEGGILALLALLNPWRRQRSFKKTMLISIGVFGAALLYGDGMITPAISVLSAVEGLETTAHGIDPFIIPITVVILAGLFMVQSRGTERVGSLFGPVTLVWFIVLAVLGIVQIWHHPGVLWALSPTYAVMFFVQHGPMAFIILGAVFLVVTGGEALYADMGHFGKQPIRLAWFCCALPCLILNYFGQGALVLGDPSHATHPFYHLAPDWARYPLIALATAATVIASQAVISGAFSLTRQAVRLGECPRVRIIQTSSEETGQVYVPFINTTLAIASIGLVLSFRTSAHLAAAYGLAVSTTMVITTVLAFFVMKERWKWPFWAYLPITLGLMVVDVSFLGANALKFIEGGWFPLLIGAAAFTLMATWYQGRLILYRRLRQNIEPFDRFFAKLKEDKPIRIPGTAVFLMADLPGTPPMLPHHLEHNCVLHEQVLLLTVVTEDVPRVAAADRLKFEELEQGFWRVYVHYGFMQMPNIPVVLRFAEELGLKIDLNHLTYYLGRESLIPTDEVPGMWLWREKIFAFMARNALGATTFYRLPPERVVELGIQVEI